MLKFKKTHIHKQTKNIHTQTIWNERFWLVHDDVMLIQIGCISRVFEHHIEKWRASEIAWILHNEIIY